MPNVYKTLDDIINHDDRYDINKIMYYTTTEDGTLVIPDHTVFTIYRRYINPYIKTYTVSKAQRDRYKRRPYILSKDVYGTPFLGWLILTLNDQQCASKFYLKSTIKLIPINYLVDIYDTIVTKASDKLDNNWADYLTLLDDYA